MEDGNMSELTATIREEIQALCAAGYVLYDAADYAHALRKFYQAWMLLPKPQTDFSEGGWILTAIGDSYFKSGQYEQGREALASALHCEGMIDNPFIHLRLGQCLLELAIPGTACTHLGIAYERGGRKMFEKEAPKYLMAALQPDSLQPSGH
jgi:tetratricopeptide (TPR) repeat protein